MLKPSRRNKKTTKPTRATGLNFELSKISPLTDNQEKFRHYTIGDDYTKELFLRGINDEIIDVSNHKSLKSLHISYCTFDSIIVNSELNSIAICNSTISDNFKSGKRFAR